MKKISFIIALLAVLLLASCSKNKSASLLPDDAVVVVRVDPLKVLGGVGAEGKDSDAKKKLKRMLKDTSMDKELRQKLEEIVDDPTASGIDFTEPFFFYVRVDSHSRPELGLVGTVASQDDITELLEAIDDVTVEDADEDGVKYFSLDREAAFIYSSDWFYIGSVQHTKGESDVDVMISKLVDRMDGDDNLAGNKALEAMCDKEGVAQALFLGQGVNSIDEREVKKVISGIEESLPKGLKVKDIALLADLALNPGEMVSTLEAVALSDEWQDTMDKALAELKATDNDFAKYVSLDGAFALLNIDAKGIFKRLEDFMEKNDFSDNDISMVRQWATTIDGKGAIDVFGIDPESGPAFVAYLGSKDNSLITSIAPSSDPTVNDAGMTLFQLPRDYDYVYDSITGDYDMKPVNYYYAGYDKGATVVTTDANHIFQAPNGKKATGNVKGQGFYARVNYKFISGLLAESDPYSRDVYEALEKILDYSELYIDEGKVVARLTSADKDKNPVAAIAEYVMQMINM
jgi:hypothetical protein